jgi:NAD(P)-dependent dehydrogenase (short-subunit alcohol dehydrogenase family)
MTKRKKQAYYRTTVTAVTGGASGLGRALCTELLRRGSTVYLLDNDEEEAGKTAAELGEMIRSRRKKQDKESGKAQHIEYLHCDVKDRHECGRVLREIYRRSGSLDTFINNAAVNAVGEGLELELQDWEHVMRTALFGTVYCSYHAAKIMQQQGGGRIINIASFAARISHPTTLPYTAAKAAIAALTKAWSAELQPRGIALSLVYAGLIDTPIFSKQKVAGMSRSDYLSLQRGSFLDAGKTARQILDAAARGKSIISIPKRASAGITISGHLPGMHRLIRTKIFKRFVSAREGTTRPPAE